MQHSAEGQEIKFLLVGGVILLAILFFMISHATSPPPPPPVPSSKYLYRDYLDHGDLAAKQVDKLAWETQGDITKVSPDDRSWLDRMTGQHGADLLRTRYLYLLKHSHTQKASAHKEDANK